MKIHEYVKEGNIDGVAEELSNGIHIETINDGYGFTPLMVAVECADPNLEMVKYLIEQGADVNAAGKRGGFVLGMAAANCDIELVDLLLEHGANINYLSSSGYDILIDAMHCRCESKYHLLPELIKLLIEKGAPLNGKSSYGESALSVASRKGWIDIIKILIDAGADVEILRWNKLMLEIALGSLDDVRRELDSGVDLNFKDSWDRTPLLLGIHVGQIDKVKLLLEFGANKNDRGRCDKTPLMYAIGKRDSEMLAWLIQEGFEIDALDEYNYTALICAAEIDDVNCMKILIDAGVNADIENHVNEKAINLISCTTCLQMLLDYGQKLEDINGHMRMILTGQDPNSKLKCSSQDVKAGAERQFGTRNPEKMNLPYWQAMVRCNGTGWQGRCKVDSDDIGDHPFWSYDRYGRTFTSLPDGRYIEIAGEHEDSYDPDFCIYNDVVVHHGDGTFDIYGYPEEVFPSTDFHSATLIDNYIYIIGSLGYAGTRRYGETPVYKMNCQTYEIEKIATSGDNPGWISEHKAEYIGNHLVKIEGGNTCEWSDNKEMYLPNKNIYILDVRQGVWSKE